MGTSAFTHRSSVDLPDPEGPMMQMTSPFHDAERDACQYLDLAECLVHVIETDDRLIRRPDHRAFHHSVVDSPLALEADRPARYRIAVDEEPAHDPKIQGDEVLAAPLGGERISRQTKAVVDAEDGDQRCRHGQDLVPVHPRRRHPLHTLRQDDHPHSLSAREGEALGRFPLADWNRIDRATDNFGDVSRDRQRQGEGSLEPAEKRDDVSKEPDLKRKEQHETLPPRETTRPPPSCV
jgi:hypothetical protein